MKIVTIIGARPQFIKAAVVSRIISRCHVQGAAPSVQELVVHTGQHYDYNMSRVFFEELSIPEPHYHLEVGSGSHGHMTGQMLAKVEDVLVEERPDRVLVYGDTNSTLAGALAGAKLHIPVAHVEAGLRSFNRRMPEEINRVLTDHVSELLFAPTDEAIKNLVREGITDGVFKVGDVMLDAFLHHKADAEKDSRILVDLGVEPGRYYLATVHRQENTDDPNGLSGIFNALRTIGGNGLPIILPLHPRTRRSIEGYGIQMPSGSEVRFIEPLGYLDMIHLEANAALILTDSGGVQKEACFAGVPCVTLRNETEWVETVEAGVNFLAGAQTDSIITAFERARTVDTKLKPGLYGDGHAAEAIVKHLLKEA
jgi:UDP-GlcNAc3NAcA epimerase